MQPGEKVFASHTLQEPLGVPGPVAAVWRAEGADGCVYALKFPGSAINPTRALRDELKAAVNACAQLTDRDVVAPLRLCEDGPLVAVESELTLGKSLATLRLEQPGRCFAPDDLGWLLYQLCRTLERLALHPGFPHGDLRPSNLLVTPRGEFRLLDYRVSEIFRRHCDVVPLNAVQRKHFFSNQSPQLIAHARADPADDIYALGATVYELLTGEPPFHNGNIPYLIENERAPEMSRRRDELAHPAPALPAYWEEAVAACLSKNPADRPKNPGEVLQLLRIDASAACPWHVAPAPETRRLLSDLFRVKSLTAAEVAPAPEAPRRSPLPPPLPLATRKPVIPAAAQRAPLTRPVVAAPEPIPAPEAVAKPRPTPRKRLSCFQCGCLLIVALIVALATLARQAPRSFTVPNPTASPTLDVPGRYARIQQAIDAAAPGQTIRVADGTYTENLRLRTGVSLEGNTANAGAVLVHPAASLPGKAGPVVTADGVSGVRIAGFEFEGPGKLSGKGRAAVVALRDSAVVMERCRIHDGAGDGLSAAGGELVLRDCWLTLNHDDGARLQGSTRGAVKVIHSVFGDNGADGLWLGIAGAAEVEDSTAMNNTGYGIVAMGGGWRGSARAATVNLLHNESRANGQAGFFFGRGSRGNVESNVAQRNVHHGIVCSDAGTAPTLHHNISSSNGGYGFVFLNGADFILPKDNGAPGNDLGPLGH